MKIYIELTTPQVKQILEQALGAKKLKVVDGLWKVSYDADEVKITSDDIIVYYNLITNLVKKEDQ